VEANQTRRGFLRGALALPAIVAVPAIADAELALNEGHAIFMIDGETVLVDTRDESRRGDSLVVRSDGLMAICTVVPLGIGQRFGKRNAATVGERDANGDLAGWPCVVVGKVIERRAIRPRPVLAVDNATG
jgi:hypothetical protein